MNFIDKWLARHRNPMSFWLHMVALPCTFVLPIVFLVMERWLLSLVMFIAGYALQFLGHLIEGNRSGEEELFRRIILKKGKLVDELPASSDKKHIPKKGPKGHNKACVPKKKTKGKRRK